MAAGMVGIYLDNLYVHKFDQIGQLLACNFDWILVRILQKIHQICDIFAANFRQYVYLYADVVYLNICMPKIECSVCVIAIIVFGTNDTLCGICVANQLTIFSVFIILQGRHTRTHARKKCLNLQRRIANTSLILYCANISPCKWLQITQIIYSLVVWVGQKKVYTLTQSAQMMVYVFMQTVRNDVFWYL